MWVLKAVCVCYNYIKVSRWSNTYAADSKEKLI